MSPILYGLQKKLVYEGTVPPAVVAKRRAKNRAARRARRINRLTTQENTRRGRTRDPRWLELVGAMAGATSEVPAPAIATFGGQR